MRKRYPKGVRKHIRRQKARIRKTYGQQTPEAKKRIEEFLKSLSA